MKELFKNKTAKGLVGLITIIIVLSSILAGTFVYENNMTANVVKEDTLSSTLYPIKEIDNINELNQLNEGFYQIINGYVFYLEHFDSYVPLHIKIKNPPKLYGLFVVDADGNVEFETQKNLPEKEVINEKIESSENKITGKVIGMESVSGFVAQNLDVAKNNGLTIQKLGVNDINKAPSILTLEAAGPVIPKEYQLFNPLSNDPILKSFAGYYYNPNDGFYNTGLPKTFLIPSSGDTYIYTNTKYTIVDVKGVSSSTSYTYNVKTVVPQLSTPQPNQPNSNSKLPQFTGGISNFDRASIEKNIKSYKVDEKGNYYGITLNGKEVFVPADGSSVYYGVRDAQGNVVWSQTTGGQYQQVSTLPNALSSLRGQQLAGQAPTTPTGGTQVAPITPQAPPAPGVPVAPSAQVAPVAPTAPTAPLPNPKDIPVGGTQGHLANDGNYYYKFPDGKLQRYSKDTNGWVDIKNKYDVVIKDSAGTVKTISIEAPTLNEARTKIPAGVSVINIAESTGKLIQQAVGEFIVNQIDGNYVVTNGAQTFFVPQDKTPETYAQELNDKAKINEAYQSWIKSQNRQDTPENRIKFNKYPPTFFTEQQKRLIVETLGLTPSQTGQPQPTQLPYTKMQLPNGQYEFTYEGKPYVTNEDKVPQELQGILDFKKNHPNAVLQEKLITTDNKKVYLENNKYIDETGKTIDKFIAKENIGGNDYYVTYEFKDGKKTAKEISVGEERIPITDNQLSAFRLNFKKGDDVSFQHENIILTKTLLTASGIENTESFRRTITTSSITIGRQGILQSESTIKTEDQNGNVLTLTKTTETYKHDEKTNKDVPLLKTQRIYEKKKGETSIDEVNGNYIETVIDSLTGEPKQISIMENGEISYASYINGEVQGIGKAKDMLSKEIRQYKSRQIFRTIERIFTEFRGLGYYATLFMSDDDLLKWRDDVDKAFATAYLGTEYWSSAICSNYLDGEQIGVAYAETPQGLAQIGAHIEATRTQPIKDEKGETSYIYKITFQVRNGDWEKDLRAPENMSINVIIKDQKAVTLFKKDINVGRGSSFGKMGSSVIVKESKTLYDRICLTFDKIPLKWKLEKKEGNKWILCNVIQESSEEPTKLKEAAVTKGAEADINDF